MNFVISVFVCLCCWRPDLMICAFWSCRLHCYIVQCSQSNVDVISLTDDSTVDISRLILHYCSLCAVRLCRRYVCEITRCYISAVLCTELYDHLVYHLQELHSQSMQKLHCVRKKEASSIFCSHITLRDLHDVVWQAAERRYWKKLLIQRMVQFIQQLDLMISVATTLPTLQNDVGLLANWSILVTQPTAQHRYGPSAWKLLWKMVRLILKSVAERIIKAQSCAVRHFSSMSPAPATTETHHQDTFRRSRFSLHCTYCLELSEQLHCR